MSRLQGWVSTLQPQYLITLPVLLGVSAAFVLGQSSSLYSLRGPIVLNIALYLLAVATTFVMLGAVFGLLHTRVSNTALRVTLIVTTPIGAALGGAVMGWARYATGLDPELLIALRVFSTVVNVSAATILMWLAVSGVRLHYQRLDALMAERDRLEALRLQASNDLATLNTQATEAVRSRILQALTALASLDAQGVLSALTATIEDTIRPLSRQLEAQSAPWTPPIPLARGSARINWRAAAIVGASPALLNPPGVLILLSLMSVPMNFFRVGPLFAIQFILLTLLIALPLFIATRWLFMRIAGKAQGVTRLLAFVGMCLMCGIGWGVLTLPLTAGTPLPLRFLLICPAFTLIFAYIWGFAAAAQLQARSTEEALLATTEELRWRIARKRELHRQQQRALSHAVHGQVQAALAAGILQLDAALRSNQVTDVLVHEVRARIVDCVRELDLRYVQPSALSDVATKVQVTWTGAVQLSVVLDQGVDAALQADPQCLRALNDLLPELVFNSIKHGRASQVRIDLGFASDRTIRLICEDDGATVAEEAVAGLGSRLLDDCSVEWSRRRCGGSTVLEAILPIVLPDHNAMDWLNDREGNARVPAA